MPRIRVHAIFDPNRSEVAELSSSRNIIIKIQKPKKLRGVIVQILEMESWIDERGKRRTEGTKNKNEILATFEGDIEKRMLIVTSSTIPEITSSENMLIPPAVPLMFEGNGGKRYKLALAKKDMEHEGTNWELGLRIKKGKRVLYRSRHATMIKGATMVYLWNRKLGDARADIFEGGNPRKDYIAQLKHHLSVLGFYRRENEKYSGKKGFRVFRREGKHLAYFGYLHQDKWDDELKKAIQTFHLAAIQRWRFDVRTQKFVEIPDSVTFDINDPKVKDEIEKIKVGDKTKEEILKWLGHNFDESKFNPKWRSPFLYCFNYAYEQFYQSEYGSRLNGLDVESGRMIANPQKNRRRFSCITVVNWFVSHLLTIGKNYSYRATGPVMHAVLGANTRRGDGKIVKAKPLYFKDYFKPVFLLPWIHPLEPEKEKLTTDFLLVLAKASLRPARPYNAVFIDITREVAEIDSSRQVAWVRYRILRKHIRNIQFSTMSETLNDWLPQHWNSRIISNRTTYDSTVKKMRIVLSDRIPSNHKLLVSYKAYDQPCTLPKGKHAWDEENLKCKCGLHKAYSEIIKTVNVNKLETWNIGDLHHGSYWSGREVSVYHHSTVLFHKKGGDLFILHGDGNHYYRSFEDEVRHWNSLVKERGMYYTIFKVDDKIVRKRNPNFLWNPESSLNSRKNEYDYTPKPE